MPVATTSGCCEKLDRNSDSQRLAVAGSATGSPTRRSVLRPPGLSPNPPNGRPSHGKALPSTLAGQRRFNRALFAASFLDRAFAAAAIPNGCYGYSLVGGRGIRLRGPNVRTKVSRDLFRLICH
ncbi:hypothetical protein T10_9273 [Trichinella papuae]|uniref:Uncharacterized protein n=1 Tax=Trichinella papuae TaxID=268474 RepID=A0A0V1MVE5_9BILA|nr:hypothetical protein T10_9273 [Trichinella papuae]